MKPVLNICFTCVGTKKLPSEIQYDDVRCANEWKAKAMFASRKMEAFDLYSGPGFEQVRRIVTKLKEKYDVTVWIFSAGFGILKGTDLIPGYDATFSSSAHTNNIRSSECNKWLNSVTSHRLPLGTVCAFPKSYEKPYRKAFGDLKHMTLVQGTAEDREDLGCSMIRCTTTLMEKIVDNQIEEGWDLTPEHWKQLRGWEVSQKKV